MIVGAKVFFVDSAKKAILDTLPIQPSLGKGG